MKRILFMLCVGISACCADIVLPPYVGDGRIDIISTAAAISSTDAVPEIDNVPYRAITRSSMPAYTGIEQTAAPTVPAIPAMQPIDAVAPVSFRSMPRTEIQSDAIATKLQMGTALVRDARTCIFDRLNLSYDMALFRENRNILSKWIDLYKQEWKCTCIRTVPPGVRMIAEVRLPRNREQAQILHDNLVLRQQEAYDAVLMTFDGTESSDYLMALALYMKNMGFQVWFSYGGSESLRVPVFIDPDQYADCLLKLATVCDGFLSHWRRTSSHLFIQDQQFMDITASIVHSANPALPILGELFFGPTATDVSMLDFVTQISGNQLDGKSPHLIPRKASCAQGYVIANLGTSNINVERVCANLLRDFAGPNYAIITGPRVYYLTDDRSRIDYKRNRAAIVALEQRWRNAGVAGTITLHGDGREQTDNMSVYQYEP